MMTKMTWLARVVVIVALGFTAGAPLAQTTTKSITTVRHFEVISVDGNKLVVRDERGTNELTVPDDFRFTVDGKKMAVSELKPGMKGTATVTTKTTVTPVVVTEFRDAVVLSAGPKMVTVRGADGVRRRFSQDELDKRGIQIVKNGQVVRVSDLHEGDALTGTIVSTAPPTVVTEREVEATTVAESKAPPPPAKMAAAEPPKVAAAEPPPPTPAPAVSPPPNAVQPASPAAEPAGLGRMWYVIIAVLVALALFFFLRRRKAP